MKLLFLLAASLGAQTLEVTPRVAMDDPAMIRATGLTPGERVTIHAELVDGGGQRWTSQAEFVAGAAGDVDTAKQAPVSGSYKEISPMGLVWSMMPAAKNVPAYQPMRDLGPQAIDLRITRKTGEPLTARLEQVAIAEGVQRIPVHDGALRGIFFVPPGAERHPGVLVLGGSNGGLPARQAAWLASRGFAALALAYFRYQDLPPQLEQIPLEYFDRALTWMAARREITPGKLAVMGTSRGGELALQLGSMFPAISAVVAYVPADVRWAACCRMNGAPAWTWKGQPLPYVVPRAMNAPRGDAAIQVEKTHGPILMISGEADHVWRSWEMADNVAGRLKRAHFAYSFQNLKYPHAGHSSGRPGFQPTWHGEVRNPTSGRELDLGGSPKGDAESTIDSMPKVLDFLRSALQ